MAKTAVPTIFCGFGSLMDIDKLIQHIGNILVQGRFGSLMDIDKLIPDGNGRPIDIGFGSLMDIDKLIPLTELLDLAIVLVL